MAIDIRRRFPTKTPKFCSLSVTSYMRQKKPMEPDAYLTFIIVLIILTLVLQLRLFRTTYHCWPPSLIWQTVASKTTVWIISSRHLISFSLRPLWNLQKLRQTPLSAKWHGKELPPMTYRLNVAICCKPTYKLCLTNEVSTTFVCTSSYLFKNRTGISLTHLTLFPLQWISLKKSGKMPHLCTARREPPRMEETISFPARLGDLWAR